MSSIFGEPPRQKPKPKAGKPASGGNTGRIPTGANTWRPAAASRPSSRSAGDLDNPKTESGGPTWYERILFGSVGTAHLARFCRQFAAYSEAGVDLLKSLASLQKQFSRTALGPVIGRLEMAVRRGESLGDAMAREPAAFDPLFLSMIRVAEARGGVPETLRMLADHYEARLNLIRQARSAVIYPAFVIVTAIAVIALLTIFVLPKLVGILEDMLRGKGVELPWPTRVLMGISQFVQQMGWWLIPLVLVATPFLLLRAYKTTRGKAALDELALYIPVLGLLLRKIDTARFARTLSALLEAGVDLGASLDLTADVVHLAPYRRILRGARQAVMEGTELSEALEASRRYPHDVIAIVGSGEETGKLPESLSKLADDYEEQVAFMVKNLGSLIQPVIVLGLGGVVFFIVLAFVMAYISVLTNLAR
jgi:type II secretory pathway component PulF